MIPYHLLAMNIQYIAFRGSSQFLQPIAGNSIYLYLNILAAFIICFLTLIYSLSITKILNILTKKTQ